MYILTEIKYSTTFSYCKHLNIVFSLYQLSRNTRMKAFHSSQQTICFALNVNSFGF